MKQDERVLGLFWPTLGDAGVQELEQARRSDPNASWSDLVAGLDSQLTSSEAAADLAERVDRNVQLVNPQVTPEAEGRYRFGAELGRGGMGVVSMVDDAHLQRHVARKELSRDLPSAEARFMREARITAQLEHPGIVPVYELGRGSDGKLYYTMRRVSGATLRQLLDRCASKEERLGLLGNFVDACQAVGFAHSRGVTHRDLKPDNLMIGPFGETLVVDWGLAKMTGEEENVDGEVPRDSAAPGDSAELTRSGTVMGTPAYMSPEQAAGAVERIDARSDVWSLGVMLFELVAGEAPFQGPTVSILEQLRMGQTPSLLDVEPAAPVALVAVVAKATARERDRRFRDAGELAREVDAWRNRTIELAFDTGKVRSSGSWALVLMGFLTTVLALLIVWGGLIAAQERTAASLTTLLVGAGMALFFLPFFRRQWKAIRAVDARAMAEPASLLRGRADLLNVELHAWTGKSVKLAHFFVLPVVLAAFSWWTYSSQAVSWAYAATTVSFWAVVSVHGYLRVPKLRREIAELRQVAASHGGTQTPPPRDGGDQPTVSG